MFNERPFTVYFDTNFFVWLGAASNEDASRVIRVFNERNIRYVQSSYVLLELVSGKERSDQDRKVVHRVSQLDLQPFPIKFGYSQNAELISWDILLLEGRERQEFSDALKAIFDRETLARSYSALADKGLSADDEKKVNEALKPFLNQIGINEDSTPAQQAEAFLSFSSDLVSQISQALPPASAEKFAKIDLSRPAKIESLQELSEQMKSILDDPVVQDIDQENQLMKSVLALDDRPFRAVTDQGEFKHIKKLGNSMRDAVHMNAFVRHSDEIDLLQVDDGQLSLIRRNKPEHFLRVRGLSSRCFSAANLESAVMQVLNYERSRD